MYYFKIIGSGQLAIIL